MQQEQWLNFAQRCCLYDSTWSTAKNLIKHEILFTLHTARRTNNAERRYIVERVDIILSRKEYTKLWRGLMLGCGSLHLNGVLHRPNRTHKVSFRYCVTRDVALFDHI